MFTRHHGVWPPHLPKHLDYPRVPLWEFLETTVRRFPDKPAIIYYGRSIPYRELGEAVHRVAAGLRRLGVQPGDRVALYLQNCPQFVIAFYGIVRAGGVVVPVNPMLRAEELAYILRDSEAKVLFAGDELSPAVESLGARTEVRAVVRVVYADYLPQAPSLPVPEVVAAPRRADSGFVAWDELLDAPAAPPEVPTDPRRLAVLPYTSGSTGTPKGCMHTHATVITNVVGAAYWNGIAPSTVHLTVLPLFHVTGLQHSMNVPIFVGATSVMLTRWDRDAALQAIARYGCTHWTNISTMVIDFLHNPRLRREDVSSLLFVGGGGAALPEAVGERLFALTGLRYVEGYGLTETISQTHFNPPHRPKLQCLGIPAPDVDCKVVDVATGRELGPGEEGELLVSGPQVMEGYWNKPDETEAAFVVIDGRRYLRTGDIVRYDEEGYFFLVDRAKRMINAAGFKVWPAEVESYLYKHPAVQEACVVGVPDPRKGEEVKAYVVLRPEYRGRVTPEAIVDWCRQRMAAYKYPRQVEFVNSLPKSGSGKVLWRVLQERERQRAGT